MGFAKTRQNQKGFVKGERGKAMRTEAAKAAKVLPERTPILGVDMKGQLEDVEVTRILEPKSQPDRLARDGDDEATRQLAESMRECGQLQPILVERFGDGRLERVFGRRRLAAAKLLGWPTIRAVIVPPLSDDARRTIVAIENVQRQNLTPAEETLAVNELMLLQAFAAARQLGKPVGPHCGGLANQYITQDVDEATKGDLRRANSHDLLLDHRVRAIAAELVAAMLGKPGAWVRDRMYIGRLSEKARKLVLDGKLPLAHAREIAKVADDELREALAIDYAAGGSESLSETEPGSLDDLREEVRKNVFSLHVVPWNRGVAFAGKPACDGCPHNSSTNPGLFEHGGEASIEMVGGKGTYHAFDSKHENVQAAGICTLPSCYQVKLRESKSAVAAAAKRIVDGERSKADAKVPAFVDAKALERKVRDRRESVKAAGKRAIGSGYAEPSPAEKAKQKEAAARHEAEIKFANAMRDRVKKLEPLLAKQMAKVPGTWALYRLFLETKLFQKTQSNAKAAAATVASPGFAAILKAVKNPSWDGLLAIEKQCGRQFDLLNPWYDGKSGAADAIAKAFGIDLGPAPTVEDFLPKPKAAGGSKSSAGTSRAKARKTGSTGGGRGGLAKPSEEPEDDELDEDAPQITGVEDEK